MGKKMILQTARVEREEISNLSLRERYFKRMQAERSAELPPERTVGTGADMDGQIEGLKRRMVSDPLYTKNILLHQERKSEAMKQYVHHTTKRKPVTEARGTILNSMQHIPRAKKEMLTPRELEATGVQTQLEERTQQYPHSRPPMRVEDNGRRVVFSEGGNVIRSPRPLHEAKPALFSAAAPAVALPSFAQSSNAF